MSGQQCLPSFKVSFVYPEGEKNGSSISRLHTPLIRTSPQNFLGQLTDLGTFLIKKHFSSKPQRLLTQSPAGFHPGIGLITFTRCPRCKSVPIRQQERNPEEPGDQSGGGVLCCLLAVFGCCCLKMFCPSLMHLIKSEAKKN